MQVWDKVGAVVMKLKKRNEINCMKYFNGFLVTGGKDKVLRIWNVTTGKCIRNLDAVDGEITCLDINGKHIACGDKAGKLSIWSLEAVLKGGQQPITAPLVQMDTKGSARSFWKKLYPQFFRKSATGKQFCGELQERKQVGGHFGVGVKFLIDVG